MLSEIQKTAFDNMLADRTNPANLFELKQELCPRVNIYWYKQRDNERFYEIYNTFTGTHQETTYIPYPHYTDNVKKREIQYKSAVNSTLMGCYVECIDMNKYGWDGKVAMIAYIYIELKREHEDVQRKWWILQDNVQFRFEGCQNTAFNIKGEEVPPIKKDDFLFRNYSVVYTWKSVREAQAFSGTIIDHAGNIKDVDENKPLDYANQTEAVLASWARNLTTKKTNKDKVETKKKILETELSNVSKLLEHPTIVYKMFYKQYSDSPITRQYSIYDTVAVIDHIQDYDVIRCFMLLPTNTDGTINTSAYIHQQTNSEEKALSMKGRAFFEYYRVYINDKEVTCFTKQSYTWSRKIDDWRKEGNINYIPHGCILLNKDELSNCVSRLKYFKSIVDHEFEVHPVTIDEVSKGIQPGVDYTGSIYYRYRDEGIKTMRDINLIGNIVSALRHPVLEQLAKSGLYNLYRYIQEDNTIEANIKNNIGFNDTKSKELSKKLGLTFKQLKYIDECMEQYNKANTRLSYYHYKLYTVISLKGLFGKDLTYINLDRFKQIYDLGYRLQDFKAYSRYSNYSSVGWILNNIRIDNEPFDEDITDWEDPDSWSIKQRNFYLLMFDRLMKYEPAALTALRDTHTEIANLWHDFKFTVTSDIYKRPEDVIACHNLAVNRRREQQQYIANLEALTGLGWISEHNYLEAVSFKDWILTLPEDLQDPFRNAYKYNRNHLGYGVKIDEDFWNPNSSMRNEQVARRFVEDVNRIAGDRIEAERRAEEARRREAIERAKKLEAKRKKVDAERKDWEFSEGEYEIRLPKSAEEIEKEGKDLCHCVGGYATRHCQGDTTIMFLRKTSEDDKSLYTIEVDDGRIVQIHGLQNRWLQNNPELTSIVVNWIKKFRFHCDKGILLSKAAGYGSNQRDWTTDSNVIKLVNTVCA